MGQIENQKRIAIITDLFNVLSGVLEEQLTKRADLKMKKNAKSISISRQDGTKILELGIIQSQGGPGEFGKNLGLTDKRPNLNKEAYHHINAENLIFSSDDDTEITIKEETLQAFTKLFKSIQDTFLMSNNELHIEIEKHLDRRVEEGTNSECVILGLKAPILEH